MVEQVEEVHQETQVLSFRNLKDLTEAEVHVLLRRANEAVPRRVSEQGCIAVPAGRKLSKRVRLICRRVYPTCQPRRSVPRAGSTATIESGHKGGARRWTSQLVSASSCRIENGKWRTRLQDDHCTGLPSAQRPFGEL